MPISNFQHIDIMDTSAGLNSKSMILAVCKSLFFSVFYVGSLYVFGSNLPRDHPITIKRRFRCVVAVSLLSALLAFLWTDTADNISTLEKVLLVLKLLGLHTDHVPQAILLPLFLTVILFLGPLALLLFDDDEDYRIESWPLHKTIVSSLNDIIWWRTYVVAPLTEEFVFRSCMLPILVPAFGTFVSVFLCPLFFGVAHIHHAIEGLKKGEKPMVVLLRSIFQTGYTTVFGAYSAFLFLRTGHLIGPVLCHSFCNFMGFPDFERIPQSTHPKVVAFCFILGLVAFIFLLFPLTDPSYYASVYWTN